MRIGYLILLLLTYAVTSQPASATAKEIPNIPPPALVECKTEATCDRDPKHLEVFVAGFYRWYVANKAKWFSITTEHLSPEERQKRIVEFAHRNKRIMQERVSAEFLAWNDKILSSEPGTYGPNPHYCGPDIDFILCVQDWPDEWMYNATAKAIEINGGNARVIINLPNWSAKSSAQYPSYRLLVNLKTLNGIWQINAVNFIVDNGK